MNRRGFMRALGFVPVAAPLALSAVSASPVEVDLRTSVGNAARDLTEVLKIEVDIRGDVREILASEMRALGIGMDDIEEFETFIAERKRRDREYAESIIPDPCPWWPTGFALVTP